MSKSHLIKKNIGDRKMSLIFKEDKEKEEKLKRDIKNNMENIQWLYNNIDKIRKKYGGKYILVKDKRIVDSHKNLKTLLKKSKNLEKNKFFVEFIHEEPVNYIL